MSKNKNIVVGTKKKKIRRLSYILIMILITIFIFKVHNWIVCDTCDYKDAISNMENNILLVNKEYSLKENYLPNNLVIPKVEIAEEACEEERYVENLIEKPLQELFNAASEENYKLYLLSGYRSYTTQKNMYEYRVDNMGEKYTELYTAKPGQSEHQTGLAVDITNAERSFSNSDEAKWLSENAYKYGFIVRYTDGKEDITGYNYEPWHIRYVGKDVARYIYDNNLTLEEYVKLEEVNEI